MNTRRSPLPSLRPWCKGGFTLLELLVVIGLIAAMSFLLIGGLTGGGKSAALQAGQATISNLVTVARTKAIATGKRTRILLPVNQSNPAQFLRFIVLQTVRDPAATEPQWDTIDAAMLPEGVYLAPRDPSGFPGLLASGLDWRRRPPASTILGSSLFDGAPQVIDLQDGAAPVLCEGISFTERGTLAKIDGSGITLTSLPFALVVLSGRRLPPSESSLPVQLDSPDSARGLIVSLHGVPALINGRDSF
jgi:prepilin-type N-terminal cleavage/methylation domain-containing protein